MRDWITRLRRHAVAFAVVTWTRDAGHYELQISRHYHIIGARDKVFVARAVLDWRRPRSVIGRNEAEALRCLSRQLWELSTPASEAALAWARDVDVQRLRLRDASTIKFEAEAVRPRHFNE